MAEVETVVTLRERNQLTLPDRVARKIGARPGRRLILTLEEDASVRLRPLLESYAGVAAEAYGGTAESVAAYLAAERASWEADDPGRATDGTRYLTLRESRLLHPRIDITPELYARKPVLRWPKCEIRSCGRLIAEMKTHLRKHRTGLIDRAGIRTDAPQRTRSRERVRKWRATMGERSRRRSTN